MNIYLSTDWHLGHRNMIAYCGRPEDFTERIVAGWSRLKACDTLYMLGDVFVMDPDEAWHQYLSRLSCHAVLIPGNHDRRQRAKWWRSHGFFEVVAYRQPVFLAANHQGFDVRLALTHFPMPEVPTGCVNVHGNTHGRNGRNPRGGRYYCLAPELDGYDPVPLEEVVREAVQLL